MSLKHRKPVFDSHSTPTSSKRHSVHLSFGRMRNVKCYSLLSQLLAVTVFTTKSNAMKRHFHVSPIYHNHTLLSAVQALLLQPQPPHLARHHVTFAAVSNVPRYTGHSSYLVITSLRQTDRAYYVNKNNVYHVVHRYVT